MSQHGRRVQRLHADDDEPFFFGCFCFACFITAQFTDDIDGLTDTWKWRGKGWWKTQNTHTRTHRHTLTNALDFTNTQSSRRVKVSVSGFS